MISEPEMTGGSQIEPAPIPAQRTAPGAGSRGGRRGGRAAGTGARGPAPDGSAPDERGEDKHGAADPGAEDPGREVIGADGPPARHLPRHWVWALTATAASCALWAAALAVWNPTHRDTPDLHGYTLSYSPCARGALAPLIGASPSSTYTEPATFSHGPALDRAECTAGTLDATDTQGASATSLVTVDVELHKRTDPRPEFEDQRAIGLGTHLHADKVTHVPGLGDDAYLLLVEPARLQLKVVHGGAVIEIGLAVSGTVTATPGLGDTGGSLVGMGAQPNLDQYGPRLIAAARTVMADLASG
ncbi:hypothetical protein V2S66_27455 [Streptomyces sp. V4-01]|uniref:Uncharacterized protein n=1 Tax=Actinacidiphila polyblastidii TaxID=3110430 RepID=A0ABU7PKU9_9ACTN|nr:hypothetical protein [Streptomyces sp. V4-01]